MASYLVFARREYEEPLSLEGEVEAEDDAAAARTADEQFGDGFIEVRLVPEPAVRWVIARKRRSPEGGGDG